MIDSVKSEMSLLSTIIVVEDIARSRTLYEGILHQKVIADFGIYNVGFEGGFSMYRRSFFQELTGRESVLSKSNSFVLYLEVDQVEEYDNHAVEIAEEMDAVLRRLSDENYSIEEISQVIGLAIEDVRKPIMLWCGCGAGGECP
jgi:hypothetical protein